MANHASALKRARQNRVRRTRNMSYKTRVKTAVKEVRAAAQEKNLDRAKEKFNKTVSIIQKTAGKGVIHRRNASRKISRLTRMLNKISGT